MLVSLGYAVPMEVVDQSKELYRYGKGFAKGIQGS